MDDDATILAASGLLAFAVSSLTLAGLLRSGLAARLAVDEPNQRSLHRIPTPRVGGIGVLAGIIAVLLAVMGGRLDLVVALGSLALVSFADDRMNLPIAVRLVTHLAVASAWLLAGAQLAAGWSVLYLAVGMAWSINLFNFMDGADGLAGGMATIGLAFCAAAAWLGGDMGLAGIAIAASAAAAGFLLFNYPPAKVFLGDVGSVPLGFLAAAIGIEGWHRGLWPVAFPLLVFSPFIVDASATLLKRVLARERFWQAHHAHYYQRLVRMGWSHRRLAVSEYALMLTAGFSALLLLRNPEGAHLPIVLVWLGIYAVLMATVDSTWRRFGARVVP